MNQTYLSSEKKTAWLLQSYKAIKLLMVLTFKDFTKPKLIFTLLFILLHTNGFGQKTWDAGGDGVNWSSANNWSPNGVPTNTDNVVIRGNATVTVNVTTATCASLQLGGVSGSGAGTLTFSGTNRSLTVVGNITVGGAGAADRRGTITFAGTNPVLTAGSLTLGNSGGTPGTNNVVNMTNGGTLNVGSLAVNTVTGNTWTPGTGTVVMTAASTLPTTIFTTFNNLTINAGTAASIISSTNAVTVNNDLTVTRGNLVLTGTDENYTVTGNLTVAANGTLTHNVYWDASGRLVFLSGNLDISGAFSYSGVARSHIHMNGVNKTIRTGTAELSILTLGNTSGTISANGSVIINDNFWSSYGVSGGTFATAGNTVTAKWGVLHAGGTLLINGGTLNVTGGLYNGFNGASGLDGIVTFSSGTFNADFVNIGDGTRVGTFTHTGGIANIGNLTINATTGNAYTCTGTPTINITGTWTNNRTFTAASSTVNFTATSAQTINGTLSGTTGKFNNVTFNGAGGTWTNNAVMEVGGVLTMTNGILTTSAANMLNITNTAVGGMAGGSSASFVNGPVRWTLPSNLASGSAYNFPIGKGTSYLPFSLVNPTTAAGTVTAQAEAFNTGCGGTPVFSIPTNSNTLGSLSTTEYWSLVTAGNFNNSSVSLTRPIAITPLDAIGGSTSAAGTYSSLGGTVGTYGIANSSNIGTNRFFTFGRVHGIRTSTISGSPFCAGSSVSVPFTITGTYTSGNVFTAQLSDASGSFASPVNIGTLTQTTAGTISGVIPSGTAAGTGYRIRVVSSAPSVTGSDNGSNLTINALPVLTVVNPSAVCSSSTVDITSAAVQTTNTGTSTKYYTTLALANAGGASNVAAPSAITASGTYYIRSEFATGCFIVQSVTVKINSMPVITPNKVDETCPISNNGSISPVLSGGLSNVRYIKLTQNHADYQQVAEIQAFEIFTGTNVALSSGGAVASASSIYSAAYPASEVNDGVTAANGNMWHGGSASGVGEYIQIDLQSGKNIDYIRIFNRSDCCQDRGQNMLLELLDTSNNVLYSRTVDLYQSGASAPVIANVLDVSWADGTALNRTGLDSGIYILNYADVAGCSISSPIIISNINNVPLIDSITVPSALCPGGSLNPSAPAVTANGSTVSSQGWEISTTSGGSTYVTLTLPYTVAFADNGKNIRYTAVNGCGTANGNAVAITINALPTIPVLGTVTQPDCIVPTGSVVLSGLPASGTVFQTGAAAASYTITGTTMTISGLAAGTYNFSADNGFCPSASTGSVVFNASGTKTWNGLAWSPDAPTSSDIAVINGNYSTSSNGDLNVCSAILNSGFTLTIESDHFLTIQNNLTVNGTLSILDKGSLVMVNDAGIVSGTGTSIVRRMTTAYKKSDYVYWSTPVSSSAISSAPTGTFPGWKTSYAYQYNNAWVKATAMTPAKGYIVMVPDPVLGVNTSEAVFKGTVNNGVKKITGIAADKSYLLGNPYPSALDADQFILQNSGVIGGTVYFWTHNTAIQLASDIIYGTPGSGAYAYTSDDYASYNITGGTATASGANRGLGIAPNGKIGTGQGFFTTSKVSISSTEFVFNNSMRVGAGSGAGANTQFFKTKNQNSSKTAAGIEKHRVWLNLSNAQGAFKQTLLGYIGGATNGNDELYDGKTLDGNKYIDFYSVNQNNNLVIQGRALPFDDKDEVPLGYKTGVEGSFTINIEKTDGLLVNQAVFLQDKLTNTEFDLKSGSYTFTTAKGTFDDRFVLKYKSAKTLGTDAFDVQGDQVLVAVKDKLIKITSSVETIAKVLIYDISGKQIYKNEHIKSNDFTVADFTAADQVLIVKTILENGAVTTDKIVF